MAVLIFEGQNPIPVDFADVVIRETHAIDQDVTKHPMEDGGYVSDHLVKAPRTLALDFVASNIGDSVVPNPRNRHIKAWQTVERWWTDGVLLTIRTDVKTYARMIVTSAPFPRGIESSNASRIQVTFEQVTLTATDLTDVFADTVVDSMAAEEDLGLQG